MTNIKYKKVARKVSFLTTRTIVFASDDTYGINLSQGEVNILNSKNYYYKYSGRKDAPVLSPEQRYLFEGKLLDNLWISITERYKICRYNSDTVMVAIKHEKKKPGMNPELPKPLKKPVK